MLRVPVLVVPLVVAFLVPLAAPTAQLVWTKADDGRAGHALAVFPGTGRVLLFGGAGSSGFLPDTWEWRGTAWSAHAPERTPPPRRDHALAAGPGGRLVLFGGAGMNGLLADTWEWDGTTWTQKSPPRAPGARSGHAMVFDPTRNRVVLFGGADTTAFLGDVWEWDGATWTLAASAGPPPRRGHGLVFDAARGVTLLFGGRGVTGLLADTWTWTGNAWSQGAVGGPPGRHAHAMAFDAARQRTVVFGGTGSTGLRQDTWEHDGVAWSQAAPTAAPGARTGSAMAFDPASGRIVLHAGLGANGYFADSWVWDGMAWSEPEPLTRPAARSGAAVVFDEARGKTLLFGGYGSTSLRDTWEFDGVRWRQRQTNQAPPNSGSITFDALRQQTVMTLNTANYTIETWEWDGSAWLMAQPSTIPQGSGTVAFDRARGVTVLAAHSGGVPLDTWEWDGIDWRRRWAATSPPVSTLAYDNVRARVVAVAPLLMNSTPPCLIRSWEWNANQWATLPTTPRSAFLYADTVVFDRERSRMVFVGNEDVGSSSRGPVFLEWDGSSWQQRLVGTMPGPTQGASSTYDTVRRRIVRFGGSVYSSGLSLDTWECYTLSPASFTPYGAGCPGTAGTPALSATGELPWTGTTAITQLASARPFTSALLMLGFNRVAFAGGGLPFALAPLGAPLCQLWVPPELLLVANTSVAGTARVGVPLPDDPFWIGVELVQQFAVFDPGANALGLSFSNAGAAVVGVR